MKERRRSLYGRLGFAFTTLLLLGGFRATESAEGAIIRVPEDRATIQEAIDSAGPGDEIVVATGTYPENIDLKGKAVRLFAPEGATLRGDGSNPVIVCATGEGPDTVIEGFTIENGFGRTLVTLTFGGGIFCLRTSPTLVGNWIRANVADHGGGIAALQGSPTLIDNRFEANYDKSRYPLSGGALYLEGPSEPVLRGNEIDSHFVTRGGSAVFGIDDANAILEDNVIRGNRITQSFSGGTIHFQRSNAEIRRNTIADNRSDGDGGGLLLEESSTILEDNQIVDNEATLLGGGILIRGNGVSFLGGNFISRNAAGIGGGLAIESSSPSLIDNRIIDNRTFGRLEGGGGGLFLRNCKDVLVAGGEVSLNFTSQPGGGLSAIDSSELTLRDVRLEGNIAGFFGGGISLSGSEARLQRCRVLRGSARSGGGVAAVDSDLSIEGSLVARSTAEVSGGGLLVDRTRLTLTNATIAANEASVSGGGLQTGGSSDSLTVTNSILYGNTAEEGAQIQSGTPSLVVNYSDVEGGWPGDANLDADPLFVQPHFDDFRLRMLSPCIDRGDASAPDLGDRDFEGEERIQDGDLDGLAVIDLGADEADPGIASRFGGVGAANGGVDDVLLFDGTAGDSRREVRIGFGEPIVFDVVPPTAGPNPAKFVIYAYLAEPDPFTVALQPFGLGVSTFPTPLNRTTPRQYRKAWNNLGFESRLGPADLPSSPAPSRLFERMGGVPFRVKLTLQGLIEDAASTADGPASLTNAIVLLVEG